MTEWRMAAFQESFKLLVNATEKDRHGELEEALRLYMSGVELSLAFAKSSACSESYRKLIRQKCIEYLNRMEQIKEQLATAATAVAVVPEGHLVDMECQTESTAISDEEKSPTCKLVESDASLRAYAIYSALQRTFECIVCTCIAEPRILQCCKNVAPCESCLLKLQHCPLCRAQLAGNTEQRVTRLNGFDTVYSLLKDSDESAAAANSGD